jgi:nucleoside permease NupC
MKPGDKLFNLCHSPVLSISMASLQGEVVLMIIAFWLSDDREMMNETRMGVFFFIEKFLPIILLFIGSEYFFD